MMTHGSVCSSNGTEPNNSTPVIDFDTQQASERETGENNNDIHRNFPIFSHLSAKSA